MVFPAGEMLKQVRRDKPLIHHITNNVTMGDCADATLNIGALPVMAHALREVEEMVAAARAAVLNIGTLHPEQLEAMVAMGRKARELGIPVVLDPVGAGATSYRTAAAWQILQEARPAVIKGNAGEIGTLAGIEAARVSGVQSLDGGEDPRRAAQKLLDRLDYEAVVAITGAVDLVTDGSKTIRVQNGHPLLPRIVGSGCMAASLVASFAAVEKDLLHAAGAALAALGVAAERAAAWPVPGENVSPQKQVSPQGRGELGPASFKVRLLDALSFLTPDDLDRLAEIEVQ